MLHFCSVRCCPKSWLKVARTSWSCHHRGRDRREGREREGERKGGKVAVDQCQVQLPSKCTAGEGRKEDRAGNSDSIGDTHRHCPALSEAAAGHSVQRADRQAAPSSGQPMALLSSQLQRQNPEATPSFTKSLLKLCLLSVQGF